MELDLENNQEEIIKTVHILFNEGKSSFAIASDLGWMRKPGPKGFTRPLEYATKIIVNQILGLSWNEYKKARNRISYRNREGSGFTVNKKAEILKRDKKCIVCGSTEKLHVHHLDIDKTNNENSNLVVVCSKLHSIIHSNKTAPIKHWNYNANYWKPRIKLLRKFVKEVNMRKELNKIQLKMCECGKHYEFSIRRKGGYSPDTF